MFNTAECVFNVAEHKFNVAEHMFNDVEQRIYLGFIDFIHPFYP